jgi:hypothetical protein
VIDTGARSAARFDRKSDAEVFDLEVRRRAQQATWA